MYICTNRAHKESLLLLSYYNSSSYFMARASANLPYCIDIPAEEIVKAISPYLKEVLEEFKDKLIYPPSFLTRKEAAKMIGISLPTLDKYTKDGIIEIHRLEGTNICRYKRSDIEYLFLKVNRKQ